MLYFNNTISYNAKFNLALEEVLFRDSEISEDILLLWQNSNSVIIGKNQLTQLEIDQEKISKYNIEVVRRLTGGGSVYHDLGNLNYSIIINKNKKTLEFTNIITQALNKISPKIIKNERNDLILDNYKISGVSIGISKEKILLHGTLLIDSNLNLINEVLTPNKKKFQNKRIKSVKVRISNLKDLVNNNLNIQTIKKLIINEFRKNYSLKKLSINKSLIKKALKLKENKYNQEKWNFNKFPGNQLITKKFNSGLISISYRIHNNTLKDVQIYGDFFYNKEIENLQKLLNGLRLSELKKFIYSININKYILGISPEEFLELFRGNN